MKQTEVKKSEREGKTWGIKEPPADIINQTQGTK